MFTGNRGCLVDDDRRIVRHHASNLWIVCATSFRDWSHPLDEPRRWTPVFFLDDAVALAAGHRPCATCRREAYESYRSAVARSLGFGTPVRADELNHRLARERLRRGSGIDRGADRRLWSAPMTDLPDGTVVVDDGGQARLVLGEHTHAFAFDGWSDPQPRSTTGAAWVLTPPTSVAALTHGFVPALRLAGAS